MKYSSIIIAFFALIVLSTWAQAYKYNFDNINAICRINYSFEDNGSLNITHDSDCYTGGRLLINFGGNFLNSEGQKTQIKLIVTMDDGKSIIYQPSIGWGGVWYFNETIPIPRDGKIILVKIQIKKGDDFNHSREFKIPILDTY